MVVSRMPLKGLNQHLQPTSDANKFPVTLTKEVAQKQQKLCEQKNPLPNTHKTETNCNQSCILNDEL